MIAPKIEALWKDRDNMLMDPNGILAIVHKSNINNFDEINDYDEMSFFEFSLRNKSNRKKGLFFYLTEYLTQAKKIIVALGYDTDDVECLFPKAFYPCFFRLRKQFYIAIAPNTNNNSTYEI